LTLRNANVSAVILEPAVDRKLERAQECRDEREADQVAPPDCRSRSRRSAVADAGS
jgi:hypothetical protein